MPTEYVFISYARDDQAHLSPIKQAIRNAGSEHWADTRIEGGEDFEHLIKSSISEAFCFVLLLTENSVGSEWVKAEFEIARDCGVPVIPLVRSSNADLYQTRWFVDADWLAPIRRLHAIPFTETFGKEAQAALTSAVSKQHAKATQSSRVMSFLNFKGGVGKTTLSALTAMKIFEQHNDDILIIDLDPQESISEIFLSDSDLSDSFSNQETSLSLFEHTRLESNGVSPPDFKVEMALSNPVNFNRFQQIAHNVIPASQTTVSFDIIPSDTRLMKFSMISPGQSAYFRDNFHKALTALKRRYSTILLDCGPSASLLANCVLEASDAIIAPVRADNTSIRGVSLMEKAAREIYGLDIRSKTFALFNFFRPKSIIETTFIDRFTNSPEEFDSALEVLSGKVLNTKIRDSGELIAVERRTQDIREHNPSVTEQIMRRKFSRSSEGFSDLCNELAKKIRRVQMNDGNYRL